MVKVVFFDFYETLCFHRHSLEENLARIAERYDVEIDWERCETALKSLFASTSAPTPTTDYSLLESSINVMIRECEFIREIGIENHVEQIAWELLQFAGHPLFAGNNTILYCHRKFRLLSKPRLCYNNNLLKRSIRWSKYSP